MYIIKFIKELEKNKKTKINLFILNKNIYNYVYGRTKYGLVKISKDSLFRGSDANIKSAINKSKYFSMMAKEVHKNNYSYKSVKYVNAKTKVKIWCNSCDKFFYQTPDIHLRKNGCYECGRREIAKKQTLSIEELINRSILAHGDKYIYCYDQGKTSTKNKIAILCKKHGVFHVSFDNHTRASVGCQKCKKNRSRGESSVENFLIKNNISFINQKKFDGCKNKNKLPFDFYLPDLDICIEYDGIQHFEPVKQWGGEKRFRATIKKDKIKSSYCLANNIKLIRIPYTEFDNINSILTKELIKEKNE